jgi:hypothetical protein
MGTPPGGTTKAPIAVVPIRTGIFSAEELYSRMVLLAVCSGVGEARRVFDTI